MVKISDHKAFPVYEEYNQVQYKLYFHTISSRVLAILCRVLEFQQDDFFVLLWIYLQIVMNPSIRSQRGYETIFGYVLQQDKFKKNNFTYAVETASRIEDSINRLNNQNYGQLTSVSFNKNQKLNALNLGTSTQYGTQVELQVSELRFNILVESSFVAQTYDSFNPIQFSIQSIL
ncbi:hypothetical protein ABPG72_016498 [Tetrahymena utriculariae]